MATAPQIFTWDGDAMKPRHPKLADKQFVVGETYRMAVEEERSHRSHAHEFAWLANAWQSLPEHLADQYPSPEFLRKRALIQAGYYTEQIIDCGSNAAALRVSAAFRSREQFALVIVRGAFVVIREAKSQSRRAMKAAEFQESKTAIMAVVAEMIGVDPEALAQARAA